MSTDNQKKRKREHEVGEDTQPRKARAIGNQIQTESEENGALTKVRGQSRQEKSERRSKKTKRTTEKGPKTKRWTAHLSQTKDTIASGEDFVSLSAESAPMKKEKKKSKKEKKKEKKKLEESSKKKVSVTTSEHRFIVFVGNLPYETTTEQIEAHFTKLSPFEVRHRVDKSSGKSRGFAFLEFEDYDKMKTCLQLYHHSIFDPEANKMGDMEKQDTIEGDPKRGRRINVELTAGGGGKSQERTKKIKTKNQKLAEERERRRQKDKLENAKVDKLDNGTNVTDGQVIQENLSSVHPSRLSRVPQ